MALCMKMNKRMQALEGKSAELLKKKSILLDERKYLVDLLSTEMKSNIFVVDDQDLDVPLVQEKWNDHIQNNRDKDFHQEQRILDLEKELRSLSVISSGGGTSVIASSTFSSQQYQSVDGNDAMKITEIIKQIIFLGYYQV